MVCEMEFWGIYSTSTHLCMCEMTYAQGLETIQMAIKRGWLIKQLYIHIMEY